MMNKNQQNVANNLTLLEMYLDTLKILNKIFDAQ